MKEIRTNLVTEAVFSDDQAKRYLLRKEWDSSKPKLAIIMLAPSEASGIELDSTTLLVLNNASRLEYGSVTVLNLFATLDDFTLKQAEETDSENLDITCLCLFWKTLYMLQGLEKQKIKSSRKGRGR